MAVIKFKKREEIKILFGIKLPSIVTEFYKETKNKKRAYEIMRDTLNISDGRLSRCSRWCRKSCFCPGNLQ